MNCIICNKSIGNGAISQCFDKDHQTTVWTTFIPSDEPHSYRIIFYNTDSKGIMEQWSFTQDSVTYLLHGDLVFENLNHIPYKQAHDFIKRVKKLNAFL